jgi:hypothetical protein
VSNCERLLLFVQAGTHPQSQDNSYAGMVRFRGQALMSHPETKQARC